MLLRARPVPFLIDDDGELREPVQCNSCKTIMYMTPEEIADARGRSHPIWCSKCEAGEAQASQDFETYDEAH